MDSKTPHEVRSVYNLSSSAQNPSLFSDVRVQSRPAKAHGSLAICPCGIHPVTLPPTKRHLPHRSYWPASLPQEHVHQHRQAHSMLDACQLQPLGSVPACRTSGFKGRTICMGRPTQSRPAHRCRETPSETLGLEQLQPVSLFGCRSPGGQGKDLSLKVPVGQQHLDGRDGQLVCVSWQCHWHTCLGVSATGCACSASSWGHVRIPYRHGTAG